MIWPVERQSLIQSSKPKAIAQNLESIFTRVLKRDTLDKCSAIHITELVYSIIRQVKYKQMLQYHRSQCYTISQLYQGAKAFIIGAGY